MNGRTHPLIVGQMVRDQIGHWYKVLAVINPWLYRVEAYQDVFGTLYPFRYRPIVMGRSELRADGE